MLLLPAASQAIMYSHHQKSNFGGMRISHSKCEKPRAKRTTQKLLVDLGHFYPLDLYSVEMDKNMH